MTMTVVAVTAGLRVLAASDETWRSAARVDQVHLVPGPHGKPRLLPARWQAWVGVQRAAVRVRRPSRTPEYSRASPVSPPGTAAVGVPARRTKTNPTGYFLIEAAK
ncbi:hypothetical protein GCM10010276_87010 [Streptomyces longisporus]|uniref:Secreted protein n=1 Tax=Streptomyces longisporus TaxID=1948 RepID=A0ABP6AT10_STRLO